jgi:glucosylceramidase
MHWTGAQLHTFLVEHLGPTFAAQGIADEVGIFLSTFPVDEYENYVAPSLRDPTALKYLAGMGVQYSGVGMLAQIRAARPGLKTWETETPCGQGRAVSCGSGPGTHNNSWQWGEGQWMYMRAYIESGASVYSQWNMVLDETGLQGGGWG